MLIPLQKLLGFFAAVVVLLPYMPEVPTIVCKVNIGTVTYEWIFEYLSTYVDSLKSKVG